MAMEIARQEEVVAKLQQNGQDATEACQLLRQFRELKILREAERDELIDIAAKIPV